MTVGGAAHVAPHDHTVTFYDADADAVSEIGRFVAEGLASGSRTIVIATPAHRAALDEVLLQHPVDVDQARATGDYLALDAAETLAQFMVDGAPDPGRFRATVGSLVARAGENGRAVRAFGEMVALLWADGNVTGALALESLWNDLATDYEFELLCAYPATVLTDDTGLEDVREVCWLHSGLQPPRSYSSRSDIPASSPGDSASRMFVPSPLAVGAVRTFVASTVLQHGHQHQLTDALVVASELATNAVRHTSSPFRLTIDLDESAIRIAVEDADRRSWPQLREVPADDFGGRGIAIVAHIADRWGCDPTDAGKCVWAELAVS